ncbi:MAG: hypothetical protein AAF439_04960 [Pseudomonadota bacterium]
MGANLFLAVTISSQKNYSLQLDSLDRDVANDALTVGLIMTNIFSVTLAKSKILEARNFFASKLTEYSISSAGDVLSRSQIRLKQSVDMN